MTTSITFRVSLWVTWRLEASVCEGQVGGCGGFICRRHAGSRCGSLHGAGHIDGGGGGCGVVVVGDLACESLARGRCACVVQRTRRSWH